MRSSRRFRRFARLRRIARCATLLVAAGCGSEIAGVDPRETDPDPPIVALDLPLVSISASGGHTCAVAATGRAYCWGPNTFGELGNGTTTASTVPVLVSTSTRLVSVSLDGFVRWPEYGTAAYPHAAYSCGLDADGTAYCWGSMTYGQLGTGEVPCIECPGPDTSRPERVLGGPYTQLSAGHAHACALAPDGAAVCWGDRSGAPARHNTPGRLETDAPPFTTVSAGFDHTCALTGAGVAYCWGGNRWGEIGVGAVGLGERQDAPVRIDAPPFAAVFAGDNDTCALTPDGTAYCWGRNDVGQLGNGAAWPVCVGEYTNTSSCAADPDGPQPVAGGQAFTTLAVGQLHVCGLDPDGRAYCWGARDQIGRTAGSELVPAPVETSLRFRTLAAGARHTCGIALDGRAYCWGEGRYGQLGNGTHDDAPFPEPVADRR